MQKISIGKKLFLTMALVFTLVLTAFGISVVKQYQSTTLSAQVADRWLPAVSKVSELNVNVANYRRVEVLLAFSEDKADQATHRDELGSVSGNLMIYRKVFEPYIETPEQQKLYEEFSAKWDQYLETHDKLDASIEKGDLAMAQRMLLDQSQKQYQEAYDLLQKLGNSCFESGIAASSKAGEAFEKSKYIILGAMLFSVLFGGFLMFKITRTMIRSLISISENIVGSSDQVNGSSDSLSTASNTFSNNISSAAASIEETMASMEELSSIAKTNVNHSEEAAKIASDCHTSVEQGQVKIQALINAMNTNYQNSAKMQDMLTMIDDIAFQTNLLALNAAVEAARAGEHGRGFAVVADAVRSLAQKSAVAAKEITDLLGHTLTSMKKGVDLAAEGEVAFTEIVKFVSEIRGINESIAQASHEQSQGVEQITKAMGTIDMTSQENAKTSQDLESTAALVKSEADRLNEIVLELKQVIHGNVNKISTHTSHETEDSVPTMKSA